MRRITTVCIYCLKRTATIFCGHVKNGREGVIAGWCQACYARNHLGFLGHYRPVMKAKKNVVT